MESEEVYVFQGPGETVCSSSNLADMREKGDMCDVTFHAENRSFQAHRIVLAAAIPYFEAMFRSNMMESSKEDIELEGIDSSALNLLLNFVYTNRLPITNLNVIALFETSRYLQFDIGMNACFQFFCERISVDNVFTLRSYASADRNKDDLVSVADRFIRQNFEDVSKTDEFNSLSFDMLKALISRDDLYVLREEAVFESVIRWVRGDEANRKVHLPDLLGHVRLNLLPLEYFNERVCKEKYILASPCECIIKEAKENHKRLETSPFLSVRMAQERVCEEKHHLKCTERMGSALYIVCETKQKGALVYFYNISSEKFVLLHKIEDPILNGVKHVVCTKREMYFLQRKRFQMLSLESFQLTQMDHREIELSGCGIGFYHGTVYLFGGSGNLDTVRTFDLRSGKCQKTSTMSERREFPGIAPLEPYIYIIGGNSNLSAPCSVERFDPLTGASVCIKSMLTINVKPNCCALNGKIYVYGEIVDLRFHRYISQIEIAFETYDPSKDEWNTFRSKKQSSIHFISVMGSFPHDNKVYFLYDSSPLDTFISICTYDPKDDVWKNEEPTYSFAFVNAIPSAVSTNSAAVLNGSRGYFPAGGCHSKTGEDCYDFTSSESD